MMVRQQRRFPASPQSADGRLIGYARVSTQDQNLDLQIDALLKAGVARNNIHAEKVSGVSTKRPALDLALKDARRGDTLVVWKLDRFGRSTLDLLRRIEDLEKRGIGFKSITDSIDTTTPAGRMLLNVTASMAQFERETARERSIAGLKAHIERGGKVGAPRALSPEKVKQGKAWRAKGMSVREIARRFNVTTQTIYVRVVGRATRKK